MPRPVDIHYTVVDGNGNTSQAIIHVDPAADVSDVITYARQMAELLDAITKGKVVGAKLGIPIDLSGLTIKDSPDVQSDNERSGALVFLDVLGLMAKGGIPAITDDCIRVFSHSLRGDYVPLNNYINGLLFGIGGIRALSTAGNILDALVKAEELFRKNMKGHRK
jgi:hypothetical protein